MSYHTRKIVKIRKSHQCHGCAKVHAIGDQMEANTGASSEAGRYSYHLCLDCAPIAKDYWDQIQTDDSFEFGAVADWMDYHSVTNHADLKTAFDAQIEADKKRRELANSR